MSRLIAPQFKDVPPYYGLEADRSLDAEDIDKAFSEIANVLNGNIGIDNLSPSARFSCSTATDAIQNAFENGKSYVCLRGFTKEATNDVIIGVTSQSSWAPVSASVILSTSSTPTVTLYYGASTLATGVAGTPLTADEAALYGLTNGFRVVFSSFLVASVPAGSLIRASSSVATTSGTKTSASCAFKAGHL